MSIECGRMTHHHPTGYLGSLVTALFTSYAIQKKPVRQWAHGLMEVFPIALEYIKERGIAVDENVNAWGGFVDKWKTYIHGRGISSGTTDPNFPNNYDFKMSEEFYKSISTNDRPGSFACDATIIAFDAFLASKGSWEELCIRSICHGGLSNVIGSITGCWYGAMYGYDGVNKCNYAKVELMQMVKVLGTLLYGHSDHSFLHKAEDLAILQSGESADSHAIEPPEDEKYIYVREGKSLTTLIDQQVKEIRKDVATEEAVHIGNAIYTHLRNFFDKLGDIEPDFKVSELLKVGSFHEGTKIYYVDEFDFIAVLAEFSKPGAVTIQNSSYEEDVVDLRFGRTSIADAIEKIENKEVSSAFKFMEMFCTKLYNAVMTDRKYAPKMSLYDHQDRAEWMPLPPINDIELSIRFCEGRLPNMVWEFLYQGRRLSVDITIALRYSNIEELYNSEVATLQEIGRAVVETNSILLVAYLEGFRKTFTETEVQYIQTRLGERHRNLYMYLKSLNYKYGDDPYLQAYGNYPFSSYMLKTVCIYHDQVCDAATADHESCLRDIVEIMDASINTGYLHEPEIFKESHIGYLPSIFNNSKNLYKEEYKAVDRLTELRKLMIRDLQRIHLSGKKWPDTRHLLLEMDAAIKKSREEVCRKNWSDSEPHGLVMLKVK